MTTPDTKAPHTIPLRLCEIADELSLDLSSFEVPKGASVDWEELFGWMRHWASENRSEEINDIEARYDAIERALDEIEPTLTEENQTSGATS